MTLMARTLSKLEQAAKDIVKTTGCKEDDVSIEQIDVTKPETIEPAFKKAAKLLGPIDVLVSGAGICYPDYILT